MVRRASSPNRLSMVKQVTLRTALAASKVSQGVHLVHVAHALAMQPAAVSYAVLEMHPGQDALHDAATERAATASRGAGPARARAAAAALTIRVAQAAIENDVSWIDTVRVARGITPRPGQEFEYGGKEGNYFISRPAAQSTSTRRQGSSGFSLPIASPFAFASPLPTGLSAHRPSMNLADHQFPSSASPTGSEVGFPHSRTPSRMMNVATPAASPIVGGAMSGGGRGGATATRSWQQLEDLTSEGGLLTSASIYAGESMLFPDFPSKNPALVKSSSAKNSWSGAPGTSKSPRGSGGNLSPRARSAAAPAPSPRPPAPRRFRREGQVRFSEDGTQTVTYDSHIALETTDGWFLTMHPKTGVVSVREPEEDWLARRAPPFAGPNAPIFVWRVANMKWPLGLKHGQPVSFGDAIWLVAIDGSGADTWQSGAVLAPKVSAVEHLANFNHADAWNALGGALLGPPPAYVAQRKTRPLGTSAPRLHTNDPVHFVEPIEGIHSARSEWPGAHRGDGKGTGSGNLITPIIYSAPVAPGNLRESLQQSIANLCARRANHGAGPIFPRLYLAARTGLGTIGPTRAFVPSHAVHVAGGSFILVHPPPGTKGDPHVVRANDMEFPGAYSRQQDGPLTSAAWEFKRPGPESAGEVDGRATEKRQPTNRQQVFVTGKKLNEVCNFNYVALSIGGQYLVHQSAQPDFITLRGDGMATEGEGEGDDKKFAGSRGDADRPSSRGTTASSHAPVGGAGDAATGGGGESPKIGRSRAHDSSIFVKQEPDGRCGGSRRVPVMVMAGRDGVERKGYFRVRLVLQLGAAAIAATNASVAIAVESVNKFGGKTEDVNAPAEKLTLAVHGGRSSRAISTANSVRSRAQFTLDDARVLRLGAIALRAPPIDANGNPTPVTAPDVGDTTAVANLVSLTREMLQKAQVEADHHYLDFEVERVSRGAPLAYAQLVRSCSYWDQGRGEHVDEARDGQHGDISANGRVDGNVGGRRLDEKYTDGTPHGTWDDEKVEAT